MGVISTRDTQSLREGFSVVGAGQGTVDSTVLYNIIYAQFVEHSYKSTLICCFVV